MFRYTDLDWNALQVYNFEAYDYQHPREGYGGIGKIVENSVVIDDKHITFHIHWYTDEEGDECVSKFIIVGHFPNLEFNQNLEWDSTDEIDTTYYTLELFENETDVILFHYGDGLSYHFHIKKNKPS